MAASVLFGSAQRSRERMAPRRISCAAGWKRAFVYAFATARVGPELRVYYNARDGWAQGVERIGMSYTRVSHR